MKKIFTLLALVMMTPWVGWGQEVWDGTIATQFAGGSGTETDPYQISNGAELAFLAQEVNNHNSQQYDGAYYILTEDINLNDGNCEEWEANAPNNKWIPIGNANEKFHGTFDGCGHTISGLYISNDDKFFTGLFGYTTGSITNINVSNSYIAATNVGGIVGHLESNELISKCSFNGIIKVKMENEKGQDFYNASPLYCGGICGQFAYGSNIESCYFKGKIEAEINGCSDFGGKNIGGIVGASIGKMKDCYNEGDIVVTGSENTTLGIYVGGIAGSGSIYGCYNIGSVTISVKNNSPYDSFPSVVAGGIVGTGSEVKYCYNTNEVSNQVQTGTNYKIGEIVGNASSVTLEKNYILSTEESTTTGITSATGNQFKSGEAAWNLRGPFTIDDETTILGFGQDLQDASITSPTLLAFTPGKEVYKLTLNYSGYNNEEQEEKFANSGFLNLPELVASENDKEVGWYDNKGTLYTSTSAISDDITLYAKKQTLHNITIETTEGGSVSADKKQAIVGKTITLTVTPDEGYALESISATTKEGQSIDIVNNSFTMPDADVTVSATFAKIKYTVTIGELTNGSITIGEEGKTEAVFVPGDPVSLNITPDEGYDIDQLFLNDVEITGTTFEMPAANVVVTATFKLKPVLSSSLATTRNIPMSAAASPSGSRRTAK